ncbi:MAG: hypothetical protein RBS39_04640 [Phycisphaerales bacterium]|jgi:hypothetical protein|nr:hypothetical protein [Phycisphaerales bacterium]
MRFDLGNRSGNVRMQSSAESLCVGEAWAMLGMLAAGLVLIALLTAERVDHRSHFATGAFQGATSVELGAR